MSSDVCSLADICSDISYGYTASSTKDPKGPKFLRITDIQGGRFRWGDVPYCEASANAVEKYALRVGDIVVARTGNTTGENAQIWRLSEPAVFASYLIRFRVDPERANPFFVGYQLRSERFFQYVESVKGGSAQPGANAKQLGAFAIRLPLRDVQDDAVDVLSTLDRRIEILELQNRTLEEMAAVIFKNWFIDYGPVGTKAEGRDPEGMSAEVATLFPDEFIETSIGLTPKGWAIRKLGDLLSVLETGRRPKGGVGGIEHGVPSIGAESISKVGEFDYGKVKYVSSEFYHNMRSGKLCSHDVLLYKDGGKPGVFLPRVSLFGNGFPFEECGINEHVFRLRVNPPLTQEFLYFWMWSDAIMHELKHRGGKAAIPGINQSDVRDLNVLVPSDLVMNAFSSIVSPLINKILENAKSTRVLIELRDSLLPRLLSGQLSVIAATGAGKLFNE